jgi:hypothetical protein
MENAVLLDNCQQAKDKFFESYRNCLFGLMVFNCKKEGKEDNVLMRAFAYWSTKLFSLVLSSRTFYKVIPDPAFPGALCFWICIPVNSQPFRQKTWIAISKIFKDNPSE